MMQRYLIDRASAATPPRDFTAGQRFSLSDGRQVLVLTDGTDEWGRVIIANELLQGRRSYIPAARLEWLITDELEINEVVANACT